MLRRIESRNELATLIEDKEEELLAQGFVEVDDDKKTPAIHEYRKFSYADGGFSVAYVIEWNEAEEEAVRPNSRNRFR